MIFWSWQSRRRKSMSRMPPRCKRVAACSGWEAILRSNARSNENNLLEKETIKSKYFQTLDKYWRTNKIKSHKRSEYFWWFWGHQNGTFFTQNKHLKPLFNTKKMLECKIVVFAIISLLGKDVIYSQDLGYSILGLRILNPGNLVLGLRFKDPES